MKIAQVVFDIALDRHFDYEIPEEMRGKIFAGMRVSVPFGGSHKKIGFVTGLASTSEVKGLKAIEKIMDSGAVLGAALLKLARWMADYWVHPLGLVLATMLPAGVREAKKDIALTEKQIELDAGAIVASDLEPSDEQSAALKEILPAVNAKKFEVFLIHGVTGSGKTEIYLRAIADCIQQGRQAVFIVPEISLTPQMEDRFNQRFPGNVALFHSRLSERERRIHWFRFYSGRAAVALGARSGVFAPAKDLGLIVVDEEHEKTFKQEDGFKYNGRDVAVMRAHVEGVPVLLGSATPSVESYANCLKGKYRLIELKHRVSALRLPHLKVVDMAAERDIKGAPVLFSRHLIERIEDTLKKENQVLLFLNRRGFSTVYECAKCGWTLSCGHCSVALTFHKTHGRAFCHVCGYNVELPQTCPECGGKKLELSGAGTQKIEACCRRIFPSARIRRIDTDSMKEPQAFERIYRDILDRRVDILVGTQMLAKGLHFPHLTLAGIIAADSSLFIPDFRAGETTFQTIIQVAGRVGRSSAGGEVIVQTQNMENFIITCVLKNDYRAFVERELEFRRELKYPPFERFIRVLFSGKKEDVVEGTARDFYQKFSHRAAAARLKAEITVPTPAVVLKVRNNFRHHLLVKTANVQAAGRLLRAQLEALGGRHSTVRIAVDVDPYHML